MCLAIPMEIVAIENEMATCAIDGISVNASVALVPHAKIGDWAIVHAGFAIELLDEEEALKTIELFNEIEASYVEGQEE
jgi:hydrogenase expression/formation protein HypC